MSTLKNLNLAELKLAAKNAGLHGYSKYNKSTRHELEELLESFKPSVVKPSVVKPSVVKPSVVKPYSKSNEALNTLLKIVAQHEDYRFTLGAIHLLSAFARKLSVKSFVIPRYLGEAADEYKGDGIFPDRAEYVLKELIDLAVNHVRDNRSRVITEDDIMLVAKNDADISLIL
jgi:hypothetical protein